MTSRKPPEQHTRQGTARGQQWGTLDRETDGVPHGMDEARSPGNYTNANRRSLVSGRQMSSAHLPIMCGETPIPCRLCQPDQPCSFHEDDAAS